MAKPIATLSMDHEDLQKLLKRRFEYPSLRFGSIPTTPTGAATPTATPTAAPSALDQKSPSASASSSPVPTPLRQLRRRAETMPMTPRTPTLLKLHSQPQHSPNQSPTQSPLSTRNSKPGLREQILRSRAEGGGTKVSLDFTHICGDKNDADIW